MAFSRKAKQVLISVLVLIASPFAARAEGDAPTGSSELGQKLDLETCTAKNTNTAKADAAQAPTLLPVADEAKAAKDAH